MSKGRRTRADRADKRHLRAVPTQLPRSGLSRPMMVTVPESVTGAELTTVQMIAAAMGSLPEQPACSGPVLVHADGAFECHGTVDGEDCPGVMAVFHGDDALDPCQTRPGIRTLHACPRCLTHSDGAELAEHTCTGQLVEHDDGTTDCTAGEKCLGADALHMSSRSCRFAGPCPPRLPAGVTHPGLRSPIGRQPPTRFVHGHLSPRRRRIRRSAPVPFRP